MIWRRGQDKVKKLVPAVSNLCFVHWTKHEIENYIRSFGEKSPVHFYWDRTTASPLVVPDKAMEDFITIASTLDEDLIFLTEVSEKLREGQAVMVKEGPFKGVEGKIVRIRKSRRVLVELPGMLAVASTYVDPKELEII
jgi:transcription antitermination factor NusG